MKLATLRRRSLSYALVAFGDPFEAGDQRVAVSEPVDVGAALQNTGSHDLLSASAADAEQELRRSPHRHKKEGVGAALQ